MNEILNVQGMTCGHCEKAVSNAITALDPDALVTIDRSTGKVEVQSQQSRDALVKAIVEEGYEVLAQA